MALWRIRTAVPAHRREVGDDVTRALLLTARLRAHPNRLPEALAEPLMADDARWTNLTSADDAGETATGTTMLVPVGPLRGVLVVRGARLGPSRAGPRPWCAR